jgi:hypothetical protein
MVVILTGIMIKIVTIYSDDNLSSSLNYYANKLQAQKITQIVANLKHPYDTKGISITNPFLYFSNPPWLKT